MVEGELLGEVVVIVFGIGMCCVIGRESFLDGVHCGVLV